MPLHCLSHSLESYHLVCSIAMCESVGKRNSRHTFIHIDTHTNYFSLLDLYILSSSALLLYCSKCHTGLMLFRMLSSACVAQFLFLFSIIFMLLWLDCWSCADSLLIFLLQASQCRSLSFKLTCWLMLQLDILHSLDIFWQIFWGLWLRYGRLEFVGSTLLDSKLYEKHSASYIAVCRL